MTTLADVGAASLLESRVRRDLMALLEGLPERPVTPGEPTRARGLTARELGERLDLHVTTVRFHVDQLVAAGLLLTRDERGAIGRPKRHYLAAATPPPSEPTEAYRLLASMLAEAMASDDNPTPEDAGRKWIERHCAELIPATIRRDRSRTPGEWLAKVGVLVDLMTRWGYAPSVSTSRGTRTARLDLAGCPLRNLATTDPRVACGVHRGILAGALCQLGEPDAEVEVVPFASPDLCVARVTTRADFLGGNHD